MNFIRTFSFTKILFLFIFSLSIIIGLLYYQQRINQFKKEILELKESHKQEVKNILKKEIDMAIDYINYKKETTLNRLKQELKDNVELGYKIANQIYLKYKESKSEEEIIDIIKTTLKEVRFFDSRGYFYIYNIEGKNILHPLYPDVENTYNHMNIKNRDGSALFKKIEKELILKDSAYIDYYFYKKYQKRRDVIKLGFVKKLGFYNLYIGTAEYLNDFEKNVQNEIFNRLRTVRFGKDGYLFIDNFEGEILMHPMKPEIVGKNLIDYQDDNGKYVIKELIDAAKTIDGRFVYYSWNKPNSLSKEYNKVSFARGIADWEWMIGGGLYIDDINSDLKNKEEIFKKELYVELAISFIVILTISLIFFLFFYVVNKKAKKSFTHMIDFFEEANEKNIFLDKKDIYFEEFHRLAEVVNNMIASRKKNEEELYTYQEQLQYQVNHDFLTKLHTRKFFMEYSNNILNIAQREKRDLSIAMIDIDNFKLINDTYGHEVGDKVLIYLAKKMKAVMRESDFCARIGGEEFAILMPNTQDNGAMKVITNLVKKVESSIISLENLKLSFTISAGVAQSNSHDINNESIENILKRADTALYQSKNNGKNRVSLVTFQENN